MQRDAARSPGLIVVVCALALSMAPGAGVEPARASAPTRTIFASTLYPSQNGVPVPTWHR